MYNKTHPYFERTGIEAPPEPGHVILRHDQWTGQLAEIRVPDLWQQDCLFSVFVVGM
jgi:hypothetical protein